MHVEPHYKKRRIQIFFKLMSRVTTGVRFLFLLLPRTCSLFYSTEYITATAERTAYVFESSISALSCAGRVV